MSKSFELERVGDKDSFDKRVAQARKSKSPKPNDRYDVRNRLRQVGSLEDPEEAYLDDETFD